MGEIGRGREGERWTTMNRRRERNKKKSEREKKDGLSWRQKFREGES